MVAFWREQPIKTKKGTFDAQSLTDKEFNTIPEVVTKDVVFKRTDTYFHCYACDYKIGECKTLARSGTIECPECKKQNRYISPLNRAYKKGEK